MLLLSPLELIMIDVILTPLAIVFCSPLRRSAAKD